MVAVPTVLLSSHSFALDSERGVLKMRVYSELAHTYLNSISFVQFTGLSLGEYSPKWFILLLFVVLGDMQLS